jgi:hypothetical protein
VPGTAEEQWSCNFTTLCSCNVISSYGSIHGRWLWLGPQQAGHLQLQPRFYSCPAAQLRSATQFIGLDTSTSKRSVWPTYHLCVSRGGGCLVFLAHTLYNMKARRARLLGLMNGIQYG